MVHLAGKAFFSEGVGIDEEWIISPELVEFFAELGLIFFDFVLFYLLIRVLLVLPDGDGACTFDWPPFLPKLGLAHIRVVVSHF